MTPPKVNLKNPYLAVFLAWLIPGLGHAYQGRRGKSLLYFVCIFGLYLVGLYLGEGKIVFWNWVNPLQNGEDFRLAFISQFWVGIGAIPALIQSALQYYETAPILGGFMAAQPQNVVNGLHRLGKFLEVGVLYTEIAGLLNILAMYDAFEGPPPESEPESVNERTTSNVAVEAGR